MAASNYVQAASNDTLLASDLSNGVHTPKVILASGTITTMPGSTGAGVTDATTQRVVQATDGTVLGPVTETAPATDIASSGLNGRLQRIAQRLTSLIAQIPATLGQKTAANSLAVVLSSDVNTVTANAGTNLNTSTLALEAGGNLAAMAAVEGTTAGAAVITDANGTIQQYLRGLIKQWIAGTLVLGAGTNKIGTVKQRFFSVAFSTLTRAANATPYSINDSISDNATPGSVTALVCTTISDVNDAPIVISEILLDTNDTGLAAATSVRAFLFNSDPTASSGVGGGDNLAYSQKRAGFIGSFSGSFRAFSDGGKARLVPDEGSYVVANSSSGGTSLWIQYQALAAFTPSGNSTTIDAKARGFQGSA